MAGSRGSALLLVTLPCLFADYVYFENSSSNPYLIRRIEELNKVAHAWVGVRARVGMRVRAGVNAFVGACAHAWVCKCVCTRGRPLFLWLHPGATVTGEAKRSPSLCLVFRSWGWVTDRALSVQTVSSFVPRVGSLGLGLCWAQSRDMLGGA